MSDPGELHVGETPEGAIVPVRLRPRASRGGPAGFRDGALELRVTAPPVGGEANEAARRLLAELLGLAPSRVRLKSGARSRAKLFLVAGVRPDEVRDRLAAGLPPGWEAARP